MPQQLIPLNTTWKSSQELDPDWTAIDFDDHQWHCAEERARPELISRPLFERGLASRLQWLYQGITMFGGASRGKMLFFDPYDRLDPNQVAHGKVAEIEPAEWPTWQERVESTLRLAGVEIRSRDGRSVFVADGKEFTITAENFKLIVAKGGLRGYESH